MDNWYCHGTLPHIDSQVGGDKVSLEYLLLPPRSVTEVVQPELSLKGLHNDNFFLDQFLIIRLKRENKKNQIPPGPFLLVIT